MADEYRHEFERRLNEEVGCAEGCSCLTPAIHLAEAMCDRIAELEAALKPLAVLLTNFTTDQIVPSKMYVLTEHEDDADLTGREVINARKALNI